MPKSVKIRTRSVSNHSHRSTLFSVAPSSSTLFLVVESVKPVALGYRPIHVVLFLFLILYLNRLNPSRSVHEQPTSRRRRFIVTKSVNKSVAFDIRPPTSLSGALNWLALSVDRAVMSSNWNFSLCGPFPIFDCRISIFEFQQRPLIVDLFIVDNRSSTLNSPRLLIVDFFYVRFS